MATLAFNELNMHVQFASSVQGVITFALGTETAIYMSSTEQMFWARPCSQVFSGEFSNVFQQLF